jgi:hypothetical protein
MSTALAACGVASDKASQTTTTTAAVRRPGHRLPPNAIRIEWKKNALVRATRPGRLCVVTVKTGHFCASYRKGEIPATMLRIKLLEHGFVPVAARTS